MTPVSTRSSPSSIFRTQSRDVFTCLSLYAFVAKLWPSLSLKNPGFPNHFLNGCYIVLRPSAELPPPPGLLPFIGASSEHGFLPCLCRSALLRPHLPFCLCSRVIGWPSELASQLAATWSSEGTSFVLSIIPTRHVSLMVANTSLQHIRLKLIL